MAQKVAMQLGVCMTGHQVSQWLWSAHMEGFNTLGPWIAGCLFSGNSSMDTSDPQDNLTAQSSATPFRVAVLMRSGRLNPDASFSVFPYLETNNSHLDRLGGIWNIT